VADQWYSLDRDNLRHRIKNPASQTSRNKHALLDLLKTVPGWNGGFINARYGHVFPDCVVPEGDLGPEVPRRLVAGIDEIPLLAS
jgi:hypothetical protein